MIKSKIICFIFLTVFSFSSKLLADASGYVYQVIAENLDHPWGIAVLDNDDLLVTELSGQLRLIKNGTLVDRPIEGVPGVLFAGQGGLSGIAIDPNYSQNSLDLSLSQKARLDQQKAPQEFLLSDDQRVRHF